MLRGGAIVVVGGTITPSGNGQLIVVRYRSNGQLDRSFANGGIFKSALPVAKGPFLATSVVQDRSTGKLLIAGGHGLDSMLVVRLTRRGRLDRTDARPLPRMPLAVISKTEPFATAPGTPKVLTTKLEQAWPKVQAALMKLEPQTPQIFATGSDHYVEVNDPDLTISIVRLIFDRVRRAG